MAIFDGVDLVDGAVPNENQQYHVYRFNHFLPERSVVTDVTLQIEAQHVSGQTYDISARVAVEADGQPKTMRIHVVQVLDHWPPEKPYHRNTFKQAAAAQDVTIASGESQTVNCQFTFDSDSWSAQENIRIIAWAQVPTATGPAQVHQAAIRHWPLISLPDDADGDTYIDSIDNCPNHYNPDQANGDTDTWGNRCDNCPTVINQNQVDTDEDGFGDLCDNCPGIHHINQADSDSDNIGDVCDSCPEVSAPAGVDQFGRSLGTIDIDCDIDDQDFLLFAECIGGPALNSVPPSCSGSLLARADTDADLDVDLKDFQVLTGNFTGPLTSPALYAGDHTCTECHSDRHASWLNTVHATAFTTLTASGDGDNPLCLPCHTVGYGTASGFVNEVSTPHLAHIQCENCHGPGSTHVADPDNVRMNIDLNSTLCGQCHQSCHGLCGDDHHPQMEQWSTSKHSASMEDIMWEPDFEDDCMRCHSTSYRQAPAGNKPSKYEASAIECVTCHNPHSEANQGQLRLPHNQLCAQCHTSENATIGETPKYTQSEALHGTGGFTLDGSPMSGPHTEHWWGIANECSVCHVHSELYGGPDQPVNSGHTFEANMRACTPCHSEATATQLVMATQEEILMRLAFIARYFDPGDILYVDPASLSGSALAEYEVARFNYEFVKADKSSGVHNAPYTRALLHEVETYFDITPWFLKALANPGQPIAGDLTKRNKHVEVRP